MLCSACRDISLKLYTLLEDPSLDWRNLYPFPTFPHFQAFSTLGRSSCELCRLLAGCARHQIEAAQLGEIQARDESVSYQIDRYAPEDQDGPMCVTGLTFYFGWNDDPRAMRNFSAFCFVELVSEIPMLPRTAVIGRLIQSDPKSSESIALIKEWVRACNSSHVLCKRSPTTTLPSRVIDVGSPTEPCKPRLVISEGKAGQYIALTHVWGGHVPVRTTTQNLQDHLARLPLSSLPPSFHDAVLITRKLRIRYLWIDALCIVQDSAADWEAECARMGDIYRDSTLTVAAVDASDSNVGFLHDRAYNPRTPGSVRYNPLNAFPVRLSPPKPSSQDHLISVLPRNPLVHLDHHSPLSIRAWCLQEKLLSPSVLYFGADQTYFNCNTLTYLEAYGAAPPSPNLHHCLNFGKSSLADDLKRLEDDPAGSKRTAVWHRIVNEYATRALTKAEDKLPALSGLAADFARITGDGYLAGLWFGDLNENLIWVVEQASVERHGVDATPYTAPSWSWASYHGPLEFKGASPAAAKVVRAEVTLAGLDPFGRVSSGSLVFLGRCKEAAVRYSETSRIPDFTYRSQRQSLYSRSSECDDGEVEVGRCSFDYLCDRVTPVFKPSNEPKTVMCLELQGGPRSVRRTVLILAPIDGTEGKRSSYRRIGIGYVQVTANGEPLESRDFSAWEKGDPAEIAALRARNWFDDCLRQEWTIV